MDDLPAREGRRVQLGQTRSGQDVGGVVAEACPRADGSDRRAVLGVLAPEQLEHREQSLIVVVDLLGQLRAAGLLVAAEAGFGVEIGREVRQR
ncbi:MAG: hypothetical protein U1F43_20470 [Myxococcota bacterium]